MCGCKLTLYNEYKHYEVESVEDNEGTYQAADGIVPSETLLQLKLKGN